MRGADSMSAVDSVDGPTVQAGRIASPFCSWPTHWVQSTGYAWYAQPAVLITLAVQPHGTLEAAANATSLVNLVLQKRAAEVSEAGGLLILHDWRLVSTWDADARRHLMDRARSSEQRSIRGVLVAMNVGPILGAILQTACMIYSIGGKYMEIVRDIPAALARYQIATPGPLAADLREINNV